VENRPWKSTASAEDECAGGWQERPTEEENDAKRLYEDARASVHGPVIWHDEAGIHAQWSRRVHPGRWR
jgi:hypothetical protein